MRFLILMFGLVALLLFALTDVVLLFHGSHQILDISESSINCTSCHPQIADQLTNSAIHNFKCEECHRIKKTAEGKTIVYAEHNESGIFAGKEAHTAYTPRCLDCHGGNGNYYNDTWIQRKAPPAKAFNESNYGSDYSAHKPFVEQALNYGLSVGENEACIACHTNYSVEFEYKRPEYFEFNISESGGDWYVSSTVYGPTNTTIVLKSVSGAKHEFKAINQIKCEDCHSDVWQAANHSESNNYGSTKASHVCWKWSKGGGKSRNNPMHNVTCVYSEYGIIYYSDVYDNITEYCTLSCHKPKINPSAVSPPIFDETVHAAYRVSCYNCHNSSFYTNAFYNKPEAGWDTPRFRRSGGHDYLDDDLLSKPLFFNGDTCIACKRAGSPAPDPASPVHFKTWTEPNNTIYYYNLPGYV